MVIRKGTASSYPFELGVLLAVNAIADAYLVVDGPGCHFHRALAIHGRHDWFSTLLSCAGRHRVQYAGISDDPRSSDHIREVLRAVAAMPGAGAILYRGSSPPKTASLPDPVMGIEAPGSHACWLDGYAATLNVLAEGLDVSRGDPRRENVAIAGYFMDRGEGEHRGNIAEFSRMLGAVGLRLVSVWPGGDSTEELRRVRDAGTLICLPHGRKAGRTLARRLKIDAVETELPFGISGTRAWIERVARAAGRSRQAKAFSAREASRLEARQRKMVPGFAGGRLFFLGDPHLAARMPAYCAELGLSFGGTRVAGRILGGDIVVGGVDALSRVEDPCRRVEFGYPSPSRHSLRDDPFLGFEGVLGFTQRCYSGAPTRSER